MRYVIYTRVSTKDQDVAMQNKKCLSLAHSLGGENIQFVSDGVLSSSVPMKDRPALQEMLTTLDSKTTVIVYNLDRLARDDIELPTIRREIEKKGATLISCNEGSNELVLDINAVLAKHEKKKLIQRTIDKLQEKKSKMERVGTAWYGYTLDPEKIQLHKENVPSYGKPYLLIPHEEEQRNIQLMIELKEKGYGVMRICKELTSRGYMNRSGNPFQITSVDRILRRNLGIPTPTRKAYRKSRSVDS